MGADGGYEYFYKDSLLRVLTEEEISLWWKFVQHGATFEVREELLDVDEWERSNLRGEFLVDWFRLPYGTDFDGMLAIDLWYDDPYFPNNTPEEVWYYKQWVEDCDNFWGMMPYSHREYWWESPRSWFEWSRQNIKDDDGWYLPLITLPTPDEIDRLTSIAHRLPRPDLSIETWT